MTVAAPRTLGVEAVRGYLRGFGGGAGGPAVARGMVVAVKCSACGYANHNPDARACELCHAKLKPEGGGGGEAKAAAAPAATKAKAVAEPDGGDDLAKAAVAVGDDPAVEDEAAKAKPATKGKAKAAPAPAPSPTMAQVAAGTRRRSVVDAALFLLAFPVSFPAALFVLARGIDWVAVPTTVWVAQGLLALAGSLGLTMTLGPDAAPWLRLLLPIAAASVLAGSILLIRMRDGAAGWSGVALVLGGACLHGGSLLASIGGGALEGHANAVRAVDVAGDSATAVSVGEDGTLRVWDLRSGTLARTLRAHASGATGVRLERVSGHAFTCGGDGLLCEWDLASAQPVARLEAHTGAVVDLDVFRGEGGEAKALTGGIDGEVKVWNLTEQAEVATLSVHEGAVTAVAWSPDGTQAAACGADGVTAIWTPGSGATRLLERHEGRVLCVAWSGDGARLVTGGVDRSICVWELTGAVEPRVLQGPGSARAVAFFPDGSRFVTAHDSGLLQVWDAALGVPVGVQREVKDVPVALAVTPDGKTILVAAGRVVRLVPVADLTPAP